MTIEGVATNVTLRGDSFIAPLEAGSHIHGITHEREVVSCIDCVPLRRGSVTRQGAGESYFADAFPHFVIIGGCRLDPSMPVVSAIHFRTSDLETLFYDFDAFGIVFSSRADLASLLQRDSDKRDVQLGEHPVLLYFTGKHVPVETETELGRVRVQHRPRYSSGSPTGARIDNSMYMTIEPAAPVVFDEAFKRMRVVVDFLSMFAGRKQVVDCIEVSVASSAENPRPSPLRVHWSHAWEPAKSARENDLHPASLPLHPLRRMDEFRTVAKNWIARDPEYRAARRIYLWCLEHESRYGPERLVSAANLFDVLPQAGISAKAELAEELVKAKKDCLALLKGFPDSAVGSARTAVGRIGEPSLTQKVQHRALAVSAAFGERIPELDYVVKIAVRCRNLFVHGTTSGLDYEGIEHFVPFLTDALEFTFAAYDFLDSGWNAASWISDSPGWGHGFARFCASYGQLHEALKGHS